MNMVISDVKLDFDDVLIVPKRTKAVSRADIEIEREFVFKNAGCTWRGFPIISANMDTTGSMKIAIALSKYKMLTALAKHFIPEQLADFFAKNSGIVNFCFVTIGSSKEDYDRLVETSCLLATKDLSMPMINVDVANGYTETFVESVARVRDTFPKSVIMAGNVVTPNVVEELILRAGADIIRIGLGSGSSCRTRIQTGIGYPQLSAVIECADAAHGVDGQICSDGGCRTPGDIIKAFGGGSDFVALGGMFAGTAECDGEWIDIGIAKYLKFHGMASKEAQELWNGGLADYRSAEGKEVLVPFKGPVENVVKDIIGGVRSACTYVGATKLKSFTKRCTFIRVTKQYNDVFEKQNRIS